MILMHVVGLSVDNSSKTPIVVLQDESGQEVLPIWIGAMEAMAISLALSNSALPRPLTHDLLLTILGALGGRLEGVEIHDMQQNVYHADLLIRQDERSIRVDCRPSDAIALALRVGVGIRVARSVLRRTAETTTDSDDPSSLRHMRPQDAATDMMRQAAARMSATMAAMLGDEDKANVKGETPPDSKKPSPAASLVSDESEEQRLARLLQMLEPDSSRRM